MPNLTLKSMKLPKKSAEASEKLMEPEPPRYPYGLSVELSNDSLDALGMKELPDVGTTMSLVARVDVTAVSSHERAKGEERRSVSLQITDLALGADEKGAKPDAQDALYGKSRKA